MPKTKAPDPVAIDPRSDETVLAYVGPTVVAHVPARDLHGGDIARIAYVRAHQATDWDARDEDGNPPARPSLATADELASLADELVASGAYTRDVPRDDEATDEPAAPAATTTDEPAAPAEGQA